MQAEDTDEEGDDDDTDVSTISFKEDSLLTNNFRNMTTHVKSARLDAIIGAGLGLPRKYVSLLAYCFCVMKPGCVLTTCGGACYCDPEET